MGVTSENQTVYNPNTQCMVLYIYLHEWSISIVFMYVNIPCTTSGPGFFDLQFSKCSI